MGAARDYTVQYFDALKDYLHAERGISGKLEIDLRNVNGVTIDRLRGAIRDLLESSLADSAVRDIRTDTTTKIIDRKIRTTAVGFSDNLDLTTRMGFVLGEQVVLWDVLIPSILFDRNGIDLRLLKDTTENLLTWYSVASKGGLVYLKHPAFWSDAYKRDVAKIRNIPDVPNDFLGLLTAEALAEEHYDLSPYAFTPGTVELFELHKKLRQKPPSQANLDNQSSLRRFLRCGSVYALRHLSPEGFYSVIQDAEDVRGDETSPMYQDDWRKQLKEYLAFDTGDLSEPEREILRERRLDELDKVMKQQAMILEREYIGNRAKGAEKAGAVSGLFGSIMGFFAPMPAAIISTLGNAFRAYGRLRTDFGDKLPKRRDELIFQVFFNFEKQWEQELKED
ncbi:MAG: hypothetical protein AB1644_00440 [Candidatus Zixiibacteriota bacterium]